MDKIIKNEKLQGYELDNIQIHGHINDPDMWFITIRPLRIFGERLCKKTLSEQEIARYAMIFLKKEQNIINNLIEKVSQFTSFSEAKPKE